MARKPAPTKAREPETTVIVNGVPVSATLVRPWTEAEKRLPMWLRGNRLPKHVADSAQRVFLKDELPPPLANLWAMLRLARAAEVGILTVRRDHGVKPDAMDPAEFIQSVVFHLRSARDDVLNQAPPTHVAVVSARLDRLIDATKATLDAFMGEPLDRILCDSPTCDKGGRHLLPGPWEDAMKRSAEAREEAYRLSTFVGDSTAQAAPTIAVEAVGERVNTHTGSNATTPTDQHAGPPMKRPVPIAEAAHAASDRSDVLLNKLRAREYPIYGMKGAYQAELAHIQLTLPKRRAQLQRWADNNYPIE